MDLTLPLDHAAIERILPHRYPFLLVDRIIELEVDKRIVGIKNVSLNERYLSYTAGGAPVLPPTILTEVVAQVGAILVLAKPENRQRLPFFAGIERVRFRRPVHPGDVVVIEIRVLRLRSRMGLLKGNARVDGKVVVEGTMTFALGPAGQRGTPEPDPRPRSGQLIHVPVPHGTQVALHSGTARSGDGRVEDRMLETIAIILIVLWLLGMVSGYTLGNFIYVLLVIAIVLFLVRLSSGRRVV